MPYQTATVISHNIPSAKFNDIVLQLDQPMDFKAGQFITVKVTDNEVRSYSIAGKLPGNQIGLLVDSTPGGNGSKFFESLKTGDKIEFMGPFGHFFFKPEDDVDQIILLSTGCGIAPIKAILESALREFNIAKPINLYFGLRFVEDIFWDKYFNQLQAQYPNFKFHLALSKPNDCWRGDCGHITDVVKDDFTDLSRASAYICGSAKMAEEMIRILKDLNCPETNIYHEQYG